MLQHQVPACAEQRGIEVAFQRATDAPEVLAGLRRMQGMKQHPLLHWGERIESLYFRSIVRLHGYGALRMEKLVVVAHAATDGDGDIFELRLGPVKGFQIGRDSS